MPFLIWSSFSLIALIVVVIAAAFLVIKMAADYFSLPGHFAVSKGLIGQVGTVKVECTQHQRGKVYVAGAYWDAVTQFGIAHEGTDIEVVEVKERFLVVKPIDLISQDTNAAKN
jgi:membrane protein implicated in regulation of membrane protease activity